MSLPPMNRDPQKLCPCIRGRYLALLDAAEDQGILLTTLETIRDIKRQQHYVSIGASQTLRTIKPDHAKVAGYFNYDNGTGKIRGIYLQGNEKVRPIFEAWLAPFKDMGATTVAIRNTGGTDHQSFDSVGLPGFQFIQDPLEYGIRSHHSHVDTYERLVIDDLKQAATIVAWTVFTIANRDEMMPR